MRTPFLPGMRVSTNSPLVWDEVVDLIAPETLRSALYLGNANPFAPDAPLATRTYRLDEDVGEYLLATGNRIHALRPTRTRTLEIGYSGRISDRLVVSGDLHYNWVADYISPLRVETPIVRYTAESVRAFLGARLRSRLATGALSEEEFEALVEDFSGVPVGTVSGDDGICAGYLDIALNAPRNKGSVSVRWDDVRRGLTLEARTRMTSGFSMHSGPFVGVVAGHTLFDATASYRMSRIPGMTVALSGTNLFGHKTRYFLGAPEIGRLLLLRVGYEF